MHVFYDIENSVPAFITSVEMCRDDNDGAATCHAINDNYRLCTRYEDNNLDIELTAAEVKTTWCSMLYTKITGHKQMSNISNL
jgi:hypothetical protein